MATRPSQGAESIFALFPKGITKQGTASPGRATSTYVNHGSQGAARGKFPDPSPARMQPVAAVFIPVTRMGSLTRCLALPRPAPAVCITSWRPVCLTLALPSSPFVEADGRTAGGLCGIPASILCLPSPALVPWCPPHTPLIACSYLIGAPGVGYRVSSSSPNCLSCVSLAASSFAAKAPRMGPRSSNLERQTLARGGAKTDLLQSSSPAPSPRHDVIIPGLEIRKKRPFFLSCRVLARLASRPLIARPVCHLGPSWPRSTKVSLFQPFAFRPRPAICPLLSFPSRSILSDGNPLSKTKGPACCCIQSRR